LLNSCHPYGKKGYQVDNRFETFYIANGINETERDRSMKSSLFQIQIALLVLIATVCSAQDSHFSPKGVQQIPVPECLTMKGLWEGGSKPCSQTEHEAWLEMDAVQLLPTADDGGGPLFL
jgi:hypothetical protein